MLKIERLDALLKEKKMSRRQLEREAGLGTGTISRWRTNSPSMANLQKVADVLGVSIGYLSGEEDATASFPAVRIPVLGEVPCGIPTAAIEFVEDWEEISEEMSRTGSYFGLKVKGDSMSPRIQEGDVLIVRQQEQAESGDVVIVRVNGENATCKRYIRHDDGIVLQSFNPAYDPMYFSRSQIDDLPVQIIGIVVENRQKFH